MNSTLNEITLSQLVKKFPSLRPDELADDFVMARQHFDEHSVFFQHPCRFDGFLLVFCYEGEFAVDLNLQTFIIRKNMMFIYEPGNIVSFYIPEGSPVRSADFHVSAASMSFVQEMHQDVSHRFSVSRLVHEDPVLTFSEDEVGTIIQYCELTESLIASGVPGIRDALRSLALSSVFFFASFWDRKRREMELVAPAFSARSQAMVDRFVRLVTEHHLKEHYLAFYARELEITPKYLSKLVREVTGRSAPDWIDSFLVLEAKNMLKYSDMAIKEIVFKLHFPDQSSFYKFFKLHTGMIPSEYRKMQ